MKSTRQRIIAGILTLVLLTGQAGGTTAYAEIQDGEDTVSITETEPVLDESRNVENIEAESDQIMETAQVTEIAGFNEFTDEGKSRRTEYGTPQDALMLPGERAA